MMTETFDERIARHKAWLADEEARLTRHPRSEGGEVMMDWQPIETAPKDGTRVLVFDGDIEIASWQQELTRAVHTDGDGNKHEVDYDWGAFETAFDRLRPTHWMPLPEPPITTKDAT